MARKWTDDQKAIQAEKIKAWKPWKRSTGPRTHAGKQRAAKNREMSLEAARKRVNDLIRDHGKALAELERLTGKRTLSEISCLLPDQLQHRWQTVPGI